MALIRFPVCTVAPPAAWSRNDLSDRSQGRDAFNTRSPYYNGRLVRDALWGASPRLPLVYYVYRPTCGFWLILIDWKVYVARSSIYCIRWFFVVVSFPWTYADVAGRLLNLTVLYFHSFDYHLSWHLSLSIGDFKFLPSAQYDIKGRYRCRPHFPMEITFFRRLEDGKHGVRYEHGFSIPRTFASYSVVLIDSYITTHTRTIPRLMPPEIKERTLRIGTGIKKAPR